MKMRVIYSCFLIVCCIFALTAPVDAAKVFVAYVPCQTKPTDMDLNEVGKVKRVLKATQIQMENGAVFNLDNIRVPAPYEHLAKEFMDNLLTGKTVGLYANKTRPVESQADEHGNEIVHAVLEDGTWVEEALVSAGLAWVDSTEFNRDCVTTLYKSEIVARAKKRGFWASPEYKVRDPGHLAGAIGTFVVFEGVPLAVRRFGDADFLCFNSSRTNATRAFTIVLKTEDEYRFSILSTNEEKHPFSLAEMASVRIRIRGWVEPVAGGPYGGSPMMILTHPEQLEFPDGNPFQ